MAEIKVVPTSSKFDRVLTILQGACGCMADTENGTITIYSFADGDDVLIKMTLEMEEVAEVIDIQKVVA